MTIGENLTRFHGLAVVDYDFATGIADPQGTAYRLTLGEEDSLLDALEGVDDDADDAEQYRQVIERLAADPQAAALRALVIGEWVEPFEMDADPILEALVANAALFPALEALFVGDLTYEQCEMSWLQTVDDYGPLLRAFPRLARLGFRGDGPGLGNGIQHEGLRALTVQSGGLPARLVGQVCAAQLPNLEELELWIGTGNYGCTTSVETLTPLLSGKLFPRLRRLGLKNAHNADDLARAVASAPLLERLESLDLSLGTLGDAGAEALLASPGVAKLQRLDVSRHYCSPEVIERLQALEGVEVTAADGQGPAGAEDRYVMVGE